MAKPSPHQSVHFKSADGDKRIIGRVDTQVCSQQMDMPVALNDCSIWRSGGKPADATIYQS
jgi:hypothetical protein